MSIANVNISLAGLQKGRAPQVVNLAPASSSSEVQLTIEPSRSGALEAAKAFITDCLDEKISFDAVQYEQRVRALSDEQLVQLRQYALQYKVPFVQRIPYANTILARLGLTPTGTGPGWGSAIGLSAFGLAQGVATLLSAPVSLPLMACNAAASAGTGGLVAWCNTAQSNPTLERLNQRVASLAQKSLEELVEVKKALDERTRMLRQAQERLELANEEIARLTSDATSKDEAISKLLSEIAVKETVLFEQSKKLQESQENVELAKGEIAYLSNETESKEQTISKLSSELASKDQIISQLSMDNESKDQARAAADRQIQQMRIDYEKQVLQIMLEREQTKKAHEQQLEELTWERELARIAADRQIQQIQAAHVQEREQLKTATDKQIQQMRAAHERQLQRVILEREQIKIDYKKRIDRSKEAAQKLQSVLWPILEASERADPSEGSDSEVDISDAEEDGEP